MWWNKFVYINIVKYMQRFINILHQTPSNWCRTVVRFLYAQSFKSTKFTLQFLNNHQVCDLLELI